MANNSAEKQRIYDARRGLRGRGWAFIMYPESAPENWIESLRDAHMEILISPLHDKDVTATGEPKKPHHHVMLIFDAVVTEKKAKNVLEKVGVTQPPELLKSVKAYARYLVHMDDHDKYRYREKDVLELGGAVWSHYALDEGEEADRIMTEVEDWLDEQGVDSYRALCRYARAYRPDWIHVIRRSTYHLTHYVKAMTWEEESNRRFDDIVDD